LRTQKHRPCGRGGCGLPAARSTARSSFPPMGNALPSGTREKHAPRRSAPAAQCSANAPPTRSGTASDTAFGVACQSANARPWRSDPTWRWRSCHSRGRQDQRRTTVPMMPSRRPRTGRLRSEACLAGPTLPAGPVEAHIAAGRRLTNRSREPGHRWIHGSVLHPMNLLVMDLLVSNCTHPPRGDVLPDHPWMVRCRPAGAPGGLHGQQIGVVTTTGA
jgi:hypothetical protein